MDSPSPLTLEGLGDALQRHSEGTATRFQDVDRQIQSFIGQVEPLICLMREQGFRLAQSAERQQEQQRQIWQVPHHLEQHDARFQQYDQRFQEMLRQLQLHDQRLEEHSVYIRRMLDNLERRGGDGGPGGT
jgi:chaperonin cofactor prefoldin